MKELRKLKNVNATATADKIHFFFCMEFINLVSTYLLIRSELQHYLFAKYLTIICELRLCSRPNVNSNANLRGART